MLEIVLTPEQEAEAERIADILKAKATAEINDIARLLASQSHRELLGATEFQLRDAVHRLGAAGFDAALSERKKRGIQGRAGSVRTAAQTPASKGLETATSPRSWGTSFTSGRTLTVRIVARGLSRPMRSSRSCVSSPPPRRKW